MTHQFNVRLPFTVLSLERFGVCSYDHVILNSAVVVSYQNRRPCLSLKFLQLHSCKPAAGRWKHRAEEKLDVRKPEAERPKNEILFPLVHIASICFAHAVADEWIVAHLLRFTVDGRTRFTCCVPYPNFWFPIWYVKEFCFDFPVTVWYVFVSSHYEYVAFRPSLHFLQISYSLLVLCICISLSSLIVDKINNKTNFV